MFVRFVSMLAGILVAGAMPRWQVERSASDKADEPHYPGSAPQPDLVDSFAGGIIGTKHDFSDGGRLPRDLCLPCHTPHITAAEAPLLARRPADATPGRRYSTRAGGLDAASLVCLSCHDGTVARDVYAGTHAMTWAEQTSSGLRPGQSRLTNHPVGVRLPTTDRRYHSPEAVARDGRIELPDGRVQCTSCHDPHNTQRHPGMLVISNERSRLCLACHRL
jgi:predicted CXXCH cytochrome family protein